ncbi:hypothetical protein [Schaalia vaccimaxillae]|uniref:hypothetical protein n=1 Tax=Schaalia vaccimaxillae TaxID=183916 RepID=UPI0003B600D6|nr:hypothetical protein [Schaalia vaccimaxillae]
MALFEFEDGHLIPAQFGYPVSDGITPDLVDAICSQALEIVSRPLFPITWRDMSRSAEDDGTPRLTALDSTGQVVSLEVVSHLDSETLIASLSRLAETAALSWSDLAAEYPSGVEGFKTGWIQFRDSMPPASGPGPRLVMVVGSIDPQVRPALDVLASSGVEVHEMNLRQMSNGRKFLEVQAVGPRLYSHAPQVVLGQSGQMPQITSVDIDDDEAAPESPVEIAAKDQAEPVSQTQTDVTSEQDGESAKASQTGVAADWQESDAETDTPESSAQSTDATAAAFDIAGYSAADAPEESPQVSAARQAGVPVLERNEEGIRALGQIIGEEVPLVAHSDLGLPEDVFLTADGLIRATGVEFSTPEEFMDFVGYGALDGWAELRLADRQGPTLAESLNEVNVEIVREYEGVPRHTGRGRHGA